MGSRVMGQQPRGYPPVGLLLREWRKARKMSQLDLALEAGVSARHLGFVETGRTRPGRELVSRLAGALRLPLREHNGLLIAAGYAAQYKESALTNPALERFDEAIRLILRHQEPYPAFILSRHFDVLGANAAATRINAYLMEGRKSRHDNLLRQVFDPADFRSVIVNWADVAVKFLRHLQDELAINPSDDRARGLMEELLRYPDVPPAWGVRDFSPGEVGPVLMLRFRSPAGELRFFETITTFAAPRDVTLAELRIDCAFPADAHTAGICRMLAAGEIG